MTDTFPLAVVRYFAARTPEEVAECFTEDGVAKDEGRTHRGRSEIRSWRAEVDKISYRQDILYAESRGSQVTVACRIAGDFKGSPVPLDLRFDLSGDLIDRLEIS